MKKEKGIALPLTLIILTGIIISAIGLIRTNDLNVSFSGNMSEKNIVTNANEIAFKQAYDWIIANKALLSNTNIGEGYFSALPINLDINNPNIWDQAKKLDVDNMGNFSSYIIFRMCEQPNTPYNGLNAGIFNVCALKERNAQANEGNSSGFNSFNFTGTPQIFYKIFIRTVGPRGATTITERTISISA